LFICVGHFSVELLEELRPNLSHGFYFSGKLGHMCDNFEVTGKSLNFRIGHIKLTDELPIADQDELNVHIS
jgi:hypothetical protein